MMNIHAKIPCVYFKHNHFEIPNDQEDKTHSSAFTVLPLKAGHKALFHEQSPDDWIKKIIENELYNTKLPQSEETPNLAMMNISMMVLGGFIAASGIAAVAIAFTVLNAATFGVAGLVVAGIGVAAALSGVGLFATGAYKNKNITPDISLDHSPI